MTFKGPAVRVKPRAGANVPGTIGTLPAIVTHEHGKGRVVYLAAGFDWVRAGALVALAAGCEASSSIVARVGTDSRVAQLKVQTGRIVGDQIEIQSGVKPEDKLVASGGSFLSDGDLVKVVNGAAAPAKAAQAASK